MIFWFKIIVCEICCRNSKTTTSASFARLNVRAIVAMSSQRLLLTLNCHALDMLHSM